MARKRSNGRRCSFESLEDRRLLAGDVTAKIDHGNLVIKGDKLDNAITISVNGGQISVAGDTGTGTNINGLTTPFTTDATNFTGKLKISMGKGNDSVTIQGLTVDGNASIKLGKGNDTFSSDSLMVTGKTKIKTGKGDDNATITDSTLNDNLKVVMGKGDDNLAISGTTVSDNTYLNGKSGTNRLSLGAGNSLGEVVIKHFILNATPTVDLDAVNPITENNSATLTGSFTDGDLADTHTMTVDWDDPNSSTSSTFAIPATNTLAANQTINSSTDSAVLTITAVNSSTGQVTFSVQHTYADDGVSPGNNTASDTSTIGVTVTDGFASGSNTTTVTVGNQAPTVGSLIATSPIVENGSTTLTGSFTDIGVSDVHTLTVNWGDPNNSTDSTFTVPATSSLTVNQTISSTSGDGAVLTITSVDTSAGQVGFSVGHQYLDDGVSPGNNTSSDTSTITVTVADDDTGSGSNTTTVTINNSAPTVALNSVPDISEEGTATLTGSFTDIGLSDVHTLTVNWGDPNNSTDSTFTVPATSSLTVNQTISSTSGDGAVLTITAINTGTGQVSFSVQHQYTDDGVSPGNNTSSDTSTITVTVADDDTGSGSNTTTVTVGNQAPTVGSLIATSPIVENGSTTLTGSFTDIGVSDVHTLTVNWGDPNNSTDSTFTVPATSSLTVNQTISSTSGDGAVLTITSVDTSAGQVGFSVGHQYLDDGVSPGNNTSSDTSTITVTVADDDTGSGSNTTTVTINNSAPTVALNSVPDISEEGTATLTGSFTDIGLSDVHTLTVNWGDPNNSTDSTFTVPATSSLTVNQTISSTSGDGAVLTITAINTGTGQVSFSVQHQYTDDGDSSIGNFTTSDTSTITVTVADDDSQNGTGTTTVTVNNVAPTVSINSVSDIDENDTVTLSGMFTDIGLSDEHALGFDWGDPNSADSQFIIDGTATLSVGEMFNSSTDSAIFTITSVNNTTGEVGFSVQHKYLDDGVSPGNGTTSDSATITVSIEDDDTDTDSDTTTFTVNNVAPSVALDSVSDINENDTVTLTGTFTDIGLSDVHTLTVNWDDPNNSDDSVFTIDPTSTLSMGDTFTSTGADTTTVLTIASVNTTTGEVGFSVGHQYLDDGDSSAGNNTTSDMSTINVIVADDDNQSGSDTTTFTVNNVAPSVALDSVSDINENDTVTLTGTFTDIGLSDVHTLTVNWDDPNNSDDSVFTIDPTSTLSMGDTFTSTGADTTTVLTIASVNTTTGEVGFSVGHQYLDDGDSSAGNNTTSDMSTINVIVADDDNQSGSDTTTFTVNNVAPSVALDSVSDINENDTVTLTGTFTDIGLSDVHTLTVNWDDPNNSDDSVFTIDPTSTLSMGDTFTSTGADTTTVLTIASVNTTTGEVGFSVGHQYLDDGDSSAGNNTTSDMSTINVIVADDDNQSGSDTTTFTVNNVAPSVALDSVSDINENDTVTLTGTFTDIGLSDVHTLTVHWDDPNNSDDSVFTIDPTSTLSMGDTFTSTGADTTTVLTITSVNTATGEVGFSVTHTYTATGNSSIDFTIADDDMGSDTDSVSLTINSVSP